MKYTKFGTKNSETVSKLGFGTMRLPMVKVGDKNICDQEKVDEMIKFAFESGVNYYDSAYFYCDNESETSLGKAIKGIRDEIFISTKSPGHLIKSKDSYREILEHQLKKLDIDYIDFYHFHGIGYDSFVADDKKYDLIKSAFKAKEEGLIKHISFSFHDAPENMLKLIDIGIFDSLLCQYNMVDRSNEKGLEYAKSKGMGTVVMGPIGGGKLAKLPDKFFTESNLPIQNSSELALRFVLSNPNVDIALSGMGDMNMVKENIATASNSNPLSEQEINSINVLIEKNTEMSKLYCSGCKYCLPCPANVNIPEVFNCYTQYKVFGFEDFAIDKYASLGVSPWMEGEKADKCTECGKCEKRCPQKIEIRKQLKQCHSLLAKK